MADMGNTEVAATIETVVSEMVQKELVAKSVLLPAVMDFSSMTKPGMNQLDIPRAGSFAAEDKGENAALTAQVLTYVADSLALDQHKAILVRLEDIAGLQAKPDIVADMVKRMSNEIAIEVDQYLYTQLQAASAAAPDHRIGYANNPTDTIQQTDILEARKLLNIQNAPMDDRFIFISPAQEKSMLSIADFVRADAYGDARGLQNGELGRIYGMKVLMSSIADDLKSIVWQKEAIGFARQQSVKFESARDLPNVATEYLMSTIFGAKELQAGKWNVMVGTAA